MREVLFRESYRGRVVWNRRRKRNEWGEVALSKNPESDWLCVDAPELRVVSDDLWEVAHERLGRARIQVHRTTHGRRFRQRDRESRYLMVGFGRCGVCGAGISVYSTSKGKRGWLGRAFVYRCTANQKKGPSACSCSRRWPMPAVDERIVTSILGDVLSPDVVEEVMRAARSMHQAGPEADPTITTRAELARIERAIENLTQAVADGESCRH